jgi:hypothetical protein
VGGGDERSWILLTLREISFTTWPRHFSQVGIEVCSVITLGRLVEALLEERARVGKQEERTVSGLRR